MRLSTLVVGITIGLALVVAVLLTQLLYDWLFDQLGLGIILLLPATALSAIGLMGLTILLYRKGDTRWGYGLAAMAGAGLLLSVTRIGYKLWQDASPVVVRASYFNEEGLDIVLRADGTVKATENTMFESNTFYGRYSMHGDTVILKDIDIPLGISSLKDTLILGPGHLAFTLENEWRGIIRDSMLIEVDFLR